MNPSALSKQRAVLSLTTKHIPTIMSNELAVMEPQQIINVTESALTIDQVVKQRALITDCMAKAMREDQHYGKVPGCGDKPTLLQPGAQLLAHLFRLRPEYDIIETDLPSAHRRFRVTCRLFFIGAVPEIKIAEGVGESSSMESKHRFRNAAPIVEPTGEAVLKTYWELRNTEGDEAAKKWLATSFDGQNVGVKKVDGWWQVVIFKGGGDDKVENPNLADVFNTVLKIAKKRAFVDATITATASSDFFTQDLEDIRANIDAVETTHKNGTETSVEGSKTSSKKGEATKSRKAKPSVSTTPANGNDKDDDQVPMWNGENHKLLAGHLEFRSLRYEDFMEAMREAGLIPQNKMEFRQMPEVMAKGFVEDIENAIKLTEAYVSGKAK